MPILSVPLWILYLCSMLVPRDKNLIVFGVHTNSFSGNIKSIFLQKDNAYKKVFISNNKTLVEQLTHDGYTAYSKLSPQGIWHSLRAGTYIYSGFPSDINFWLSAGAKYINVWHGTPIKKIERDVTTGKYSLRNRYTWVFKILKPYLLAKPDMLLVSSAYEEACFKSAFDVNDRSVFRAFPPRLENLSDSEFSSDHKNILYVPTWRDDHSFSFSKHIDLDSFNAFLSENSMKFYIKLHPSDRSIKIDQKYSNIVFVNQNEDVYDYLKDIDLLVSDYSSMVFEALYLLKPIVLFCPDYERYQKNSRAFYIDPCKELPVEVSYVQKELENSLFTSMHNKEIDPKKFKSFKPYDIEDKILKNLVEKAHIDL